MCVNACRSLYLHRHPHLQCGRCGRCGAARGETKPARATARGADPVGPQPSGGLLGAWHAHAHTAVGRAVGGAAALVAALRTARAVRRPKPYSCCAALRKASGSSAEQLVGCTPQALSSSQRRTHPCYVVRPYVLGSPTLRLRWRREPLEPMAARAAVGRALVRPSFPSAMVECLHCRATAYTCSAPAARQWRECAVLPQ